MSSPDGGGSNSDSGERYHGDHFRSSPREPSKMETLIRATQQMIKEEENRLQQQHHNKDIPGVPSAKSSVSHHGPLAMPSVVCRGPGAPSMDLPSSERLHHHDPEESTPSPALSHLSSPSSDGAPRAGQASKDYTFHGTEPPAPPPGGLLLYPAQDRQAVDRQTYALAGYSLEHFYDLESLKSYPGLACGVGGVPYDVAAHVRMQAEQMQAHKATSVIITNGS